MSDNVATNNSEDDGAHIIGNEIIEAMLDLGAAMEV